MNEKNREASTGMGRSHAADLSLNRGIRRHDRCPREHEQWFSKTGSRNRRGRVDFQFLEGR
jgi:hypothetical protein